MKSARATLIVRLMFALFVLASAALTACDDDENDPTATTKIQMKFVNVSDRTIGLSLTSASFQNYGVNVGPHATVNEELPGVVGDVVDILAVSGVASGDWYCTASADMVSPNSAYGQVNLDVDLVNVKVLITCDGTWTPPPAAGVLRP